MRFEILNWFYYIIRGKKGMFISFQAGETFLTQMRRKSKKTTEKMIEKKTNQAREDLLEQVSGIGI